MKALIQKINAHPRYSKFYHWGKLISITGGAQAIVQITGLLSGILIIRLLPTEEYAYYTLANTMLGTMTVLADGGISASAMAQGGKVWEDKVKLGVVLSTGLYLRRKFAIRSLFVAIPALVYLLVAHEASWITILLIVASLIPAFFVALSDSLLEVVPKLHQDITSLQKNQVSVSIGQLILSGLMVLIFPIAALAILASSIPRAYGNIRLRKIAHKFADKNQEADSIVKNDILKVVKRLLPTAIYYCLSGQITIWLISVFGNTTSIAQIGALSRLSVVLNLLTTLFATLAIPRFSRLPIDKKLLLKFVYLVQGCLVLLCFLILATVYLFPSQLLSILGKNYSNLSYELLLTITGSCVSLIAGLTFSMYISRGWAIHPLISIPINIVSIIFACFIFNINSLEGMLLLAIFTATIQYVMNLFFLIFKILKG